MDGDQSGIQASRPLPARIDNYAQLARVEFDVMVNNRAFHVTIDSSDPVPISPPELRGLGAKIVADTTPVPQPVTLPEPAGDAPASPEDEQVDEQVDD